MQSLWLKMNEDHEIELKPIRLPVFPMASEDDMWTGAHDKPESVPSKAIQCPHLAKTGWPGIDGQRLIFVLTGQLEIPSRNVTLIPGDTLFIEGDMQPVGVVSFSDDCRVLLLHVVDWAPEILTEEPNDSPSSSKPRTPNFKWLYTGADGQAYFAEFNELFDERSGWGAELKPAYDTILIEQADGFFMDWHPEGANNLVVVMTGELELEAAGDGTHFETFRPGDICFAVDRTGQGHIDRARGATLLATIVIPGKAFVMPSH